MPDPFVVARRVHHAVDADATAGMVIPMTDNIRFTLNGQPVNINEIPASIQKRYGKTKGVYVRADRETIWEVIAQVVAELGTAGFQVNMVTQPEDTTKKGRRR